MKKFLSFLVAAGFTLTVCAQLSVTPAPQSTDTNNWWVKRFNEKEALVKAGGSEVVFLGDSIMNGWEGGSQAQWKHYFAGEPYRALNLGFSGDRTEHVLWRIQHGEFDGYQAKVIVLLIGTNNGGHRPTVETPIDTVLGVHAILDALAQKQPKAKIILHPIFPRGEKPDDPLRVRNDAVNNALKDFADGERVVWCDFNDQFLTFDGILKKEIMPDFLHPSDIGRDIWARNLIPVLDKCLGRVTTQKPATTVPHADFGNAIRNRSWRLERLAEKRRLILQNTTHSFDAVFFGDSITHDMEGLAANAMMYKRFTDKYTVLNIGYRGDTVQNLIWRGLNGELDGYTAKLVMLLVGTNNGNDSAEDVAAGIRRLLDIIQAKQPQAQILLLPIFPRGNYNEKNRKTNAITKGFADGKKIIWCDFTDKYLNADGSQKTELFVLDRCHPKPEGYEIWADAVLPYFKTACGK